MSRVWVFGEIVPTVRAVALSVRAAGPEVRGRRRADRELGLKVQAFALDAAAEGSEKGADVSERQAIAPDVGKRGSTPREAAPGDAEKESGASEGSSFGTSVSFLTVCGEMERCEAS